MKNYTNIIFKYIFKEFLLSFAVSFLLFFIIFFINQILVFAQEIFAKQAPFDDIMWLIVYSIPITIFLTSPFAALMGAMMTMSRLSATNEILALRSLGVTRSAIITPMLAVSLLISLFSFLVNDMLMPLSNIKFRQLQRELLTAVPELVLEAHSIKKYNDVIIITGDLRDSVYQDVVIIDTKNSDGNQVLLAQENQLLPTDEDSEILTLEMNDVLNVTLDREKQLDFNYSKAEKTLYNIKLRNLSQELNSVTAWDMSSLDVFILIRDMISEQIDKEQKRDGDVEKLTGKYMLNYQSFVARSQDKASLNIEQEKFLASLANEIDSMKEKNYIDYRLDIYWLELNKKFSVPSAAFFFIFFAFPVGYISKRSSRISGLIFGLITSLIYWSLLYAGNTIGVSMGFSPLISMWGPNFIILFAGIIIFIVGYKR